MTVRNRAPVRLLLLSASLSILVAAVVVSAQAQTGTISGRVTLWDGSLAPGATVTIALGDQRRSAITDREGQFRFADVPAGTWRAVVRLAGFLATAEDLRVIAGQTTNWVAPITHYSSWPPATPEQRDSTDPAAARAIYAIALGRIFERGVPDQVLILAESLVPPGLVDESWTGELAGVPRELREQLSPERSRSSVWHNPLAFPRGAHFATRAEIEKSFGDGSGDRWRQFQDHFGVSSYQAFSQVLISGDRRDALVEFSNHCGSLCGQGGMLWLNRAGPSDPWTVRAIGFESHR